MTLGLLAFNDQVLPRANHRLKTLQDDISQTKPTFLLKEQVINPIAEGKYYLKAGKIDRGSERNRLKEVVIYDLADPTRRAGETDTAADEHRCGIPHATRLEVAQERLELRCELVQCNLEIDPELRYEIVRRQHRTR